MLGGSKVSPVILQAFLEWPQSNPVTVFIVLGIIALAIVLFAVISRRGAANRSGGSGARYTRARFRRAADGLGLNPLQIKTLENLVQKYSVANPYSIFMNETSLDSLLQKAIAEVNSQSQTPDVKEAHKATLYRIKQLVEQNSQKKQVKESGQIALGQEVSLTGPSGTKYPSRVAAVLKDHLAVEVPVDDEGNQIRWKPWTTVQVFFFKPNGQGFSFETRVGGYNAVRGTECALLKHSNSVQQAAQRRFRRKSLERPAYFYAVQIMSTGEGRNQRKQAVAQTKGALGTILEVSAGGCSIKSSFPIAKGSLIKVEFETERGRKVIVFGKVRAVRRASPLGGTMHVQFTKVSTQYLNRINSFVYEIG